MAGDVLGRPWREPRLFPALRETGESKQMRFALSPQPWKGPIHGVEAANDFPG